MAILSKQNREWLKVNSYTANSGRVLSCSVDELEKKLLELECNQTAEAKQALFQVGKEINEETRITKNAKSFAVAIVLNKLASFESDLRREE